MNSHRFFRVHLYMDLDCLLWIYVLILEEFSWIVRSNWQNTQIKIPKNFCQFLKYLAISSISRIKYFLSSWTFNNKTTPKSVIFIERASSRPVTYWNKGDFEYFSIYIDLFCLSPVHCIHFTFFWENILRIQACKK